MTMFYVKGNKDNILKRKSQIHTITLYCPLGDESVQYLKNCFNEILCNYKTSDDVWSDVPAIDALRAVLYTKAVIPEDINTLAIDVMVGSLQSFIRLKNINFEFTDDAGIMESYENVKKGKGVIKYIYKVDVLEMNLSDMFSQDIIDCINKVLIFNGIISNSYLHRIFRIDFTYDEYVSFINMFLTNNRDTFDSLDSSIGDYFGGFPMMITEHKPEIRLITNYSII